MPTGPKLDYASPEPPKGALLTIFLIVFTDLLGFGIIIPLLPFYVPNYQQHPLLVTLLFSIYSICQFIGAPILGAISDRFGRRPVLAFSQLGSAAGYLLLGLATQFEWQNVGTALLMVYLSRIIDGFTGGNISTAQAYISDVTTEQNRAKGMGLLGAAFGIGFSLGPAVGGILGHYHTSWPAYLAASLSAAAALLSFLKLPESRVHRPVDVEAWLDPRTFLPVLKRPAVLNLLLISFLTMAAFVMMESTIGLFLNKVFGYEERQVGWLFAWAGLWIVIIQGGLIGRLTRIFGEWLLSIAGPVLVAIGMLGYMLTAWNSVLWLMLLAAAINAAGRSFHQPTLSSLISKYSRREEQGVVFGLYHGLSSMARVIGPIVAGLAYELHETGPYAVAAVATLVASAWTLLVRINHPRPQVAQPPAFPNIEAARSEKD